MTKNRRQTDTFRHRWGPVIAYLVIAGVLAFGLFLQRKSLDVVEDLAARNACETLEHRIGSRESFRTTIENQKVVLEALKALGEGAASPDDPRFQDAVDQIDVKAIVVPDPPEPVLVEQRDVVCEKAGITPQNGLEKGNS